VVITDKNAHKISLSSSLETADNCWNTEYVFLYKALPFHFNLHETGCQNATV